MSEKLPSSSAPAPAKPSPLSDPNIRGLRWPYNLLAILNGAEPIDFHVDERHEQFIVQVLTDYLPKRESQCLLGYFRDHASMQELGGRAHISRSQVDNIIWRILTKVQHKATIRDKVLYGPDAAKLQDALQQHMAELRRQARKNERRAIEQAQVEELLQAHEQDQKTRLAMLQQYWRDSGLKPPKALTDPIVAVAYAPTTDPSFYRIHINELDLSTRAYNCMSRTGNTSLGKVMDVARTGRLQRIRNLGEGTAIEILTQIFRATGDDFFEVNDLSRPCDL